MKYKTESNDLNKIITSIAVGVIIGLIGLFLILMVFSLIVTVADLNLSVASILSTVSIVASSFICGFFAAKKMGCKALIIGALSGVVFYLLITLVSLIITKNGLSSTFILRASLSVVLACVGAIFGTRKKSNKSII